jgi:hypothetical protein
LHLLIEHSSLGISRIEMIGSEEIRLQKFKITLRYGITWEQLLFFSLIYGAIIFIPYLDATNYLIPTIAIITCVLHALLIIIDLNNSENKFIEYFESVLNYEKIKRMQETH